jgi:hypothetical protein
MNPPETPARAGTVGVIVGVLWGAVLIVLLVRAGLHPERATSMSTYLTGGAAWGARGALYTNWRGFVYPPVVACFFSALNRLPLWVVAVLWRGITAGGLLFGMGALLRAGIYRRIPASRYGYVFIGLLPLSVGNLDNAQANPLIAGVMMLAVAAFQWEAWGLCAFAAAVATMFKIYPVALALLLCLLRPREISWRFAGWMAVGALLPFAMADWHYAAGQYHAWIQTRLADNRFEYPMKDAPLDLWYLLVRLGNLPVSERVYTGVQVLGGVAIAGWVMAESRRGRDRRDILGMLYLLVSVWMLLLGPATENQTYVVLAPTACIAVVEGWEWASRAGRCLVLAGFAMLVAAVARNSLMPHLKGPGFMALQPVGAILLLGGILAGMRWRWRGEVSDSQT